MAADTQAAEPPPQASLGAVLAELPGGPGGELADFARLLLAGLDDDGELVLAPAEITRIVEAAYAFLCERPAAGPRLTLRHADGSHSKDKPVRRLTIVEILNDDMPFLVSSVMGEVQARGLQPLLALHPILAVARTASGRAEHVSAAGDTAREARRESLIVLVLDALDKDASEALVAALGGVLAEVRAAVGDFAAMLARLDAAIDALQAAPASVPRDILAETIDFCRWLRGGQFTFLGMREYRLEGGAENGELAVVAGSGLGILTDPNVHVLRRGNELVAMTPEIRRFYFAPQPIIITKSNVVSRVHRRAHMDYIGIKTYRPDGTLGGELRFVGLFTAKAYTAPPQQIPFLRLKVVRVLAGSGVQPGSHAHRVLQNILDTFPRDELIQIGVRQLTGWVPALLDLELRPRLKVFSRIDRFDRFVSVLVFLPRDGYTTATRETIGRILAEAYHGRVSAYQPFFTAGPLVRVHFIIGRYEGTTPEIQTRDLERRIREATRTWEDRLAAAIASREGDTSPLVARHARAFPAGYAETFSPERALEDIDRIERLGPDRPQAIDFYAERDGAGRARAAIYRFDAPIPLSERVPILENLGFRVIDERTYRLSPLLGGRQREVCLHDMVLESADGTAIDLAPNEARLEEAFIAVFRGLAENDGFNRLVLKAGTDWREAAMMRALAGYMRQIRSPFGSRYVADTLDAHPAIARDLVELFRVRFDPSRTGDANARSAAEAAVRARIEAGLAGVASLDEDRILRQLANLVMAAQRTNYYQPRGDGAPPEVIAIKLASREVDGAPEPRPFREIWVSSPRVDGIHLRFAPIARGGLRWSDRPQDVRTEVLGLARAQQVKNTVIVPQGAKGGFVPKLLPRSGSREEVMKEGVAAYRTFVSALLDITDNLTGGSIDSPRSVVRHDGDDPYLVVAADKGTATFSDIANEISAAHRFWLGDAFASGGSAGYDHKKMGITARGAWECVKRHFREQGHDVDTMPFRVIGVGDMSGDVFGNGMLLSRQIKLVAAFDHRDIFLDPDPDPATSFAERQRLFALARSSWQDYDRTKLSAGGGVFPRSAKAITLSPEVRTLLGITAETLTPSELARAILMAKVDLAWFGGIGTYVRASAETDEQVGDRANDGLRVTAAEFGARIVGEGANLALTQRARIELARRGGRVDTDFIANSAGVNSSDQEVNIKIALRPAEERGDIGPAARVALLASMTDDVAASCLANNHQQSLALSLAERRGAAGLDDLKVLMHALEVRRLIDRRLEALPRDAELAERAAAGSGLTRPELAVLLSYAKIALTTDVLDSDLPDEAALEPLLAAYFPPAIRERYRADIAAHKLRREIVTTSLVNTIVNRGGPAFAATLAESTGRPAADIARAAFAADQLLALSELWAAVDGLDSRIDADTQLALYGELSRLLRMTTAWFAGDAETAKDLGSTIGRHRRVREEIAAAWADLAASPRSDEFQRTMARWTGAEVPGELARRIALAGALADSPDIALVAERSGLGARDAARGYYAVTDALGIGPLIARGQALAASDRYERMAIGRALEAIGRAQRELALEALSSGGGDARGWLAGHREPLTEASRIVAEILASGEMSAARLTVAAAEIGRLAGSR
ncbi:MAG: NAD-glutamate dehydrogenase [Pseudomonadota bacterium]